MISTNVSPFPASSNWQTGKNIRLIHLRKRDKQELRRKTYKTGKNVKNYKKED